MTAGLYRFGSLVFSFWASVGEELCPDTLFTELAPQLMRRPGEEESRTQVMMQPICFRQIPESAGDWLHPTEPIIRVGRLARLPKDKRSQYIYHSREKI